MANDTMACMHFYAEFENFILTAVQHRARFFVQEFLPVTKQHDAQLRKTQWDEEEKHIEGLQQESDRIKYTNTRGETYKGRTTS